jgi:hypothetical protein
MSSQSFIWNGKEWGESKREGKREREREREKDRVWLRKGCSVGHKLDLWSSIYKGYREKGYSESLSRCQQGLSQEFLMVNIFLY